MSFFLIGINHKTAPIEVRERFFLTPTQQELFLSELKHNPSVVEGFVLSTCNRTELYVKVLDEKKAAKEIIRGLYSIKGLSPKDSFEKHFYTLAGQSAVKHLLRVTTGLDSLVFGEKEILGQFKTAVELSQKKGMMGRYLNILSNCAVRAGKKAHSETQISYGGVSVSWAAITMSERILGTLKDKIVLIMGAGKMSELALSLLKKKGVSQIYVMNRSQENACALTGRFGGVVVSYSDIKEILSTVDLCFCSVGAPHYILEKPAVEKAMEKRPSRPLTLIDISMPRNIDPVVAKISNTRLVCIDDLDKVVGETMEKRKQAVGLVEEIIAEKMKEFEQKLQRLEQLSPAEYFEKV